MRCLPARRVRARVCVPIHPDIRARECVARNETMLAHTEPSLHHHLVASLRKQTASACPDGLRAQLVYHPHIAAPHSNVRESNAVPEAVFVDGFDKYPLRRFARECAAAAAR